MSEAVKRQLRASRHPAGCLTGRIDLQLNPEHPVAVCYWIDLTGPACNARYIPRLPHTLLDVAGSAEANDELIHVDPIINVWPGAVIEHGPCAPGHSSDQIAFLRGSRTDEVQQRKGGCMARRAHRGPGTSACCHCAPERGSAPGWCACGAIHRGLQRAPRCTKVASDEVQMLRRMSPAQHCL